MEMVPMTFRAGMLEPGRSSLFECLQKQGYLRPIGISEAASA